MRRMAIALCCCFAALRCGRPDLERRRAPTATAGPNSAVDSQAVELRLAVPPRVRRGSPVPLRLVVRNSAEHTIAILTGTPSSRVNFVVADDAGGIVWQSRAGRYTSAVGAIIYLAPGDSLVFRDRWYPRASRRSRPAPGTYQVRGIFVAGPVTIPGLSTDTLDWSRSLVKVSEADGGPGLATPPSTLIIR